MDPDERFQLKLKCILTGQIKGLTTQETMNKASKMLRWMTSADLQSLEHANDFNASTRYQERK